MKVEQLRCFAAVVETGSFRAAADTLHKTQPALTKSIQHLENSLDFLLFDRTQYRPVLTHKGEQFYQAIQQCLNHLEKLKEFAVFLCKDYEPCYTIAIDMAAPMQRLLPLLAPAFNAFPNTQFRFITTAINGGNELLLNQKVDLAINEHLHQDADIEAQYLFTEAFVAVATPQYAETHQHKFKDPLRLPELRQIVVTDSAMQDKYSFGLIPGAPQWRVSDIYHKKSLIEHHLGWGRLPAYVVNDAIEKGSLIPLPYSHLPTRHLALSAIRRRNYQYGPVAEFIWNSINTTTNESLDPPPTDQPH